MSQEYEQKQEQGFAGLHIDGPERSYTGYHREQERPLYALGADADTGVNPTFMMQMRLGLLIVSLILWVIVFFGSIWTLVRIPANLASVIDPLVFIGLLAFTLLAALGNFFFGHRR